MYTRWVDSVPYTHLLNYYLDRRNWKQRYFALREKTLFYYADSDLANAKPNGAIDLKDVKWVDALSSPLSSFLSDTLSPFFSVMSR